MLVRIHEPIPNYRPDVIPVALLAKWGGFDSLTAINGWTLDYISTVTHDTMELALCAMKTGCVPKQI